MSKSKETSNIDVVSSGKGYLILSHIPDKISGSMYEIIEALGLSEKQEKATKSLIQSKIWEIMRERVIIGSKLNTEIINKHYEMQKGNGACSMEGYVVDSL